MKFGKVCFNLKISKKIQKMVGGTMNSKKQFLCLCQIWK